MISDKAFTYWQQVIPQHGLSWLCGQIAQCRKPWLKNWLIARYIKHFSIDMSIAANPDPQSFANFNDFFIRALNPASRPIADDPGAIISPADGTISQMGAITDGRIVQAKGFDFTVQHLLGGNCERAQPFHGGQFMTLYLSPRDYHRVHMPYAAQLREMIYIPGRLFSVNACSTQHIPTLFARNERLVCLFETPIGAMAVVMVGALIVGSIHTTWAGAVRNKRIMHYRYPLSDAHSIALPRAAELGHFTLGSTVILLFSPNRIQWQAGLKADSTVNMGQLLATRLT